MTDREHTKMPDGFTHWGNPGGLTFDPACFRCWEDANAVLRERVEVLEGWLRNIEALGKDTHKEEPEMNCHICLMAANATEALNPCHEEGE